MIVRKGNKKMLFGTMFLIGLLQTTVHGFSITADSGASVAPAPAAPAAPATGFGAPTTGFGATTTGFGTPTTGFGTPATGFGTPTTSVVPGATTTATTTYLMAGTPVSFTGMNAQQVSQIMNSRLQMLMMNQNVKNSNDYPVVMQMFNQVSTLIAQGNLAQLQLMMNQLVQIEMKYASMSNNRNGVNNGYNNGYNNGGMNNNRNGYNNNGMNNSRNNGYNNGNMNNGRNNSGMNNRYGDNDYRGGGSSKQREPSHLAPYQIKRQVQSSYSVVSTLDEVKNQMKQAGAYYALIGQWNTNESASRDKSRDTKMGYTLPKNGIAQLLQNNSCIAVGHDAKNGPLSGVSFGVTEFPAMVLFSYGDLVDNKAGALIASKADFVDLRDDPFATKVLTNLGSLKLAADGIFEGATQINASPYSSSSSNNQYNDRGNSRNNGNMNQSGYRSNSSYNNSGNRNTGNNNYGNNGNNGNW